MTAFAQELPMSRGAYLAKLGDCTSCHTLPGHLQFSGGFPVVSPFGIIYGPNITPDPDYGIGKYSLKDFEQAVRYGIRKDGRLLYPAMPYTSFVKMTDDDIAALYDYFMHEVPPVHEESPRTNLSFPFNQRWVLRIWDWVFADHQRYQPRQDHDAAWNRGAYLVQSLGHCGACHSPRGVGYEELGTSESSPAFLSGSTLDKWYAPPLTADPAAGLGRWSEEDIADFLGTGHSSGVVVFGTMKEVVGNSGQYMTSADRAAIAHYLKSLRASGKDTAFHPNPRPDIFERPGAGLYANFCSRCHGAHGEGELPRVPKLAGNSAVLSDDPTSLIHIMLDGSAVLETKLALKPARMPGFGQKFTDQEIAAVISFIRSQWGNDAPPVTEREVRKLRKELLNEPEAATIPAQSPQPRQ